MRYLLLISCSQRKRLNPDSRAAIDVYDGPVYRTLRKMQRERAVPTNLDVFIISAKYGLIACQKPIDSYDQKMTPERANELANEVQERLKAHIRIRAYNQVFINLGKTYMLTLDGFQWGLVSTLEASGGIGQRVSQTKAFLERIWLSDTPYLEGVENEQKGVVSR